MLSSASFVHLCCVLVCVSTWTGRAVKGAKAPRSANSKLPSLFHKDQPHTARPRSVTMAPEGPLYGPTLVFQLAVCLFLSRAVCDGMENTQESPNLPSLWEMKIVFKKYMVKSRPKCNINNTLEMDKNIQATGNTWFYVTNRKLGLVLGCIAHYQITVWPIQVNLPEWHHSE